MAISPTSPLPGISLTGFTSPTYTLTADVAPNSHSKQWAVTTIGGTQASVDAHSVSSPFTLTVERPAQFKSLGQPNPVTGRINNVGRNNYKVRIRKGSTPAADQPDQISNMELVLPVPSGSDTYDSVQLKAALCAMGGFITDQGDELVQMMIDGVI